MKHSILTLLALTVIAPNAYSATTSLNLKCSVVAVGTNPFEEGLGSIYDIAEEGYVNADSDSTSASIKINSKTATFRLGQSSFSAKASDVKEVKIEDDRTALETVIKEPGAGTIKVRIFADKKVALYSIEENKGDGFSHMATVDCSGVKDLRDR